VINKNGLEMDYQEACYKLQMVTQKFENDWRQACDKFQMMEEERIEFLRNTLWNYTNLFSNICVTDDESFERIRQSLEKCDIDKDIATFIELKGINTTPYESVPTAQQTTVYGSPPSYVGAQHAQRLSEHPYRRSSPLLMQKEQLAQYQQQKRPMSMIGGSEPYTKSTHVGSPPRQSTIYEDINLASSQAGTYPPSSGQSATYPPSDQAAYPPSSQATAYPPSSQATTYPPSDQTAYPPSSQTAYPPSSQTAYPPSSQTAYPPSSQTAYPPSSQTAYPPSSQTAYPPSSQTAYPPSSQATYPPSNQPAGYTSPPSSNHSRQQSMMNATPSQSASVASTPKVDPATTNVTESQQQTSVSTSTPTLNGSSSSSSGGGGGVGSMSTKEGFLVRALYDYDASMEEELSFREGDIIRVIATQLDGWWEGEIEVDGEIRRGQFPSNFIEPLIF
jgi:hypothetical protein